MIADRLPGESPAERSLRLLREDPELLESCAMNAYEAEHGDDFGSWEGLTEAHREKWRAGVLSDQQQFANLPTELQEAVNAVEFGAQLERNNRALGDDDDEPWKVG